MKNLVRCFFLGLLFVAVSRQSDGADGIRAVDAIFQSAGSLRDHYWRMGQNGYVGTFIKLDDPATVNVAIRAKAEQTDGVWPEMDFHAGDQKLNWTVNTEYPVEYTGQVHLTAGTHLLRTEYVNDTEGGVVGNHTLFLDTLNLIGGDVDESCGIEPERRFEQKLGSQDVGLYEYGRIVDGSVHVAFRGEVDDGVYTFPYYAITPGSQTSPFTNS